jgi:hypothetical protein
MILQQTGRCQRGKWRHLSSARGTWKDCGVADRRAMPAVDEAGFCIKNQRFVWAKAARYQSSGRVRPRSFGVDITHPQKEALTARARECGCKGGDFRNDSIWRDHPGQTLLGNGPRTARAAGGDAGAVLRAQAPLRRPAHNGSTISPFRFAIRWSQPGWSDSNPEGCCK